MHEYNNVFVPENWTDFELQPNKHDMFSAIKRLSLKSAVYAMKSLEAGISPQIPLRWLT